MPYCPKCGNEVDEKMAFCPKCGVSLKGEQPRDLGEWGREFGEKMARRGKEIGERMSERTRRRAERRAERDEKYEKEEKGEKAEVHEKREFAFIGPLIGGLILVFLGLMFYFQVTGKVGSEIVIASFLVIIGVVIIAVALYAVMVAAKRHPAT